MCRSENGDSSERKVCAGTLSSTEQKESRAEWDGWAEGVSYRF